jgi:hypothetical protein
VPTKPASSTSSAGTPPSADRYAQTTAFDTLPVAELSSCVSLAPAATGRRDGAAAAAVATAAGRIASG